MQTGLILLCNDLPGPSSPDGGVMRRMKVVRFGYQFVAQPRLPHERLADPDLRQRLSSEACRDAFIRLLLGVWEREVRGEATLDPPESVTQAAREYLMDNDAVALWLAEYYEITHSETDRISGNELYRTFAGETGSHMSARVFSIGLARAGLGKVKSHGAIV